MSCIGMFTSLLITGGVLIILLCSSVFFIFLAAIMLIGAFALVTAFICAGWHGFNLKIDESLEESEDACCSKDKVL